MITKEGVQSWAALGWWPRVGQSHRIFGRRNWKKSVVLVE